MKKLLLLFCLINSLFFVISAQSVTGKIINITGEGLPGLQLQLYISPNVYSTTSGIDGTFTFSNVSDVEDENILPSGYNISNNYPNPFNPKTRFNISLPKTSVIQIEIFNVIGEKVLGNIEKNFSAGENFIDVEMNGLPNGVYFAKISVDNKYQIIKKLMLLYGSQHLQNSALRSSSTPTQSLNKFSVNNIIDSLVITGTDIKNNIFYDLPEITENNLDLGTLILNTTSTGIHCPGTPTVTYSGKTYNTVQIGNQCWLKENLDAGTMINGSNEQTNNSTIEKYCYDNLESNCDTYGGLYQWNEAMQYITTEGARGICPEGWHMPTKAEFDTLAVAVNMDGSTLIEIGSGTNTSGFSALPSGYLSSGYFWGLGGNIYIWGSSEDYSSNARGFYLRPQDNGYYFFSDNKNAGHSVRCLKDDQHLNLPQTPTLSSPSNGATNESTSPTLTWNASSGATSYTLQLSESSSFNNYIFNQSGITSTNQEVSGLVNSTTYYWRISASNDIGTSNWSDYWSFTTISNNVTGIPCPGTPTVTYSGKTYNTVQIGDQCWLKENLDVGIYVASTLMGPEEISDLTNNGIIEKYCYENNEANCGIYGGLYDWYEAMQYSTTEGSRGICPEGWHIPKSSELQELASSSVVGNDGNKLKREDQGTGSGKGTNNSGFSALLSGYRDNNGGFGPLAPHTSFWSSYSHTATYAYRLTLSYYGSNVDFDYYDKHYGYSVRCLKD